MLEVKSVSKAFRGLRAVRDASFTVPEGDINGLIGPNGAGKTTIFNIIAGVYAPDSGEIYFNGNLVHGLRPDQICAAGIGRTTGVAASCLRKASTSVPVAGCPGSLFRSPVIVSTLGPTSP